MPDWEQREQRMRYPASEKIGIISVLATDTVETSSPGPSVIFQDEIDSLKADGRL